MPEVTQHEGTISLAGRVCRTCVRFAGAYIGTLRHVQKALERAVAGPTSKLRMRMQPFLNSNLVTTQDKLSILQYAAGPRSLAGHLARVQSEIQVARAFKLGDELFDSEFGPRTQHCPDSQKAPSTQDSQEDTSSKPNCQGILEVSASSHF